MSSLDVALGDLVAKNRPARGGRGGGRGASRGGRGASRGGASNGGSDACYTCGKEGHRARDCPQGDAGPIRREKRSNGAAPYQRAPQQYVPQAQLQYAAPVGLSFARSAPVGAQWTNDRYGGSQQQQAPREEAPVKKLQGDTIHVSNLASDVTDEDVREIFERIGTVRSCIVNYTSAGVSTGTATVTFARKSDAEKAVQDYDEAEVDGRMMKLKLIGTIVTAPVVVKKQKPVIQQQQPIAPMYVQQPVSFAPAYSMDYAYEPRGPRAPKAVVSRGGGSAKPARGGAVAKPAPKPVKKEVSQADLDAELDGYHQSKAAPAPAAAGQPTSA